MASFAVAHASTRNTPRGCHVKRALHLCSALEDARSGSGCGGRGLACRHSSKFQPAAPPNKCTSDARPLPTSTQALVHSRGGGQAHGTRRSQDAARTGEEMTEYRKRGPRHTNRSASAFTRPSAATRPTPELKCRRHRFTPGHIHRRQRHRPARDAHVAFESIQTSCCLSASTQARKVWTEDR